MPQAPNRRRPTISRGRVSRYLWVGVALAMLAGGWACSPPPADPAAARLIGPHAHQGTGKPNVLFVVLDTLRADRVSSAGYDRTTTPYIDRLARDSTVYTRAHSIAPWTLPSHMSMFTGLTPGQHGATWEAFGTPADLSLEDILNRSFTLEDPDVLLPRRLRKLGYSTVGFTNNAWISQRTSFGDGFDVFYEMWKERRALRNGYGWLPPAIKIDDEVDAGDAGVTLLKFKTHLLNQPLQEPFFLFFNFIDPHFPYSPPPMWRYAYSLDRALGERMAGFKFSEQALQAGARPVDVSSFSPFYDAEVAYLDFVVGHLIEWLRQTGYYDETLIVVTSDHGEHLGERNLFGHQFSVGEELLHVPLVIKYPGRRDHREIDDPLVSNLDVYGTILGAAGEPRPADAPSLDLERDSPLHRFRLIAESTYSEPYLRSHQEAYDQFDIESNRVVRRVVYTPAGRYEFTGAPPAPAGTAIGDSAALDHEMAAGFLREYVESLGRRALKQTDRPMDPEALERLRSLGYVR